MADLEAGAEIPALTVTPDRYLTVRYAGASIPQQVKPYEPRGGITAVSAGGNGAIVSELWKDDYRFLVIVNQDYLNPMPLDVQWRSGMQVGSVQKDGPVQALDGSSMQMQVDPGDAAILMWTAAGK